MLHSPAARRLAVAATAALGAFLLPAATAAAQDPVLIQPNTYFEGFVNGKAADAVITVVCPGPLGPNAVGHPTADQTVEVRSVLPPVAPLGYTGSAGRQIDAGFNSSSSAAQSIVLDAYFAPAKIPTTWLLPCSGSGAMAFVPEPTSPTANDYTVKVTFENIAV